MAIETRNYALLPPGPHRGIITGCELVLKSFTMGQPPEETLQVTIQPKAPGDGRIYPVQEVIFTPAVNPLSALGALLKRIGKEPDYQSGAPWVESSIIGTEVTFTVFHPKADPGSVVYPRVVKESIVAAPS